MRLEITGESNFFIVNNETTANKTKKINLTENVMKFWNDNLYDTLTEKKKEPIRKF